MNLGGGFMDRDREEGRGNTDERNEVQGRKRGHLWMKEWWFGARKRMKNVGTKESCWLEKDGFQRRKRRGFMD